MRGLIAVVMALWLTAGQAAAQSGQGYLMMFRDITSVWKQKFALNRLWELGLGVH